MPVWPGSSVTLPRAISWASLSLQAPSFSGGYLRAMIWLSTPQPCNRTGFAMITISLCAPGGTSTRSPGLARSITCWMVWSAPTDLTAESGVPMVKVTPVTLVFPVEALPRRTSSS